MKCPKCSEARLVPLEVGEIMLDRCEECAGIWFDHGELEAVVGTTAASRFDPAEGAPSGLCPRCAVEMRPVDAVQDPTRRVRVDRCPSCLGLWLDRSRLQVVEDQYIPLAAHLLFVSEGADEETVAALPAEEHEVVRKVAELLQDHPERSALVGFLLRGPREAKGT